MFTFEREIFISAFDLPHETNPGHQSLLSVSGSCVALRCFKNVFLNGCGVSASVCEFSIKGGLLEIIRICEARSPCKLQTLAIWRSFGSPSSALSFYFPIPAVFSSPIPLGISGLMDPKTLASADIFKWIEKVWRRESAIEEA
jgi:hypothetical protein